MDAKLAVDTRLGAQQATGSQTNSHGDQYDSESLHGDISVVAAVARRWAEMEVIHQDLALSRGGPRSGERSYMVLIYSGVPMQNSLSLVLM